MKGCRLQCLGGRGSPCKRLPVSAYRLGRDDSPPHLGTQGVERSAPPGNACSAAPPPRSHDHATGATGVGSVVGAWRCRVQLHATGWCMVDDAWSPARFGALGPASVIMMSEIEQLDPRIQPSATCACAYRTTFGESQREHDRW